MNIKPMLVRLESAIGRNDLMEQMMLLPGSVSSSSVNTESKKSVNLIVGYNRSPSSQTALDVALWIAHQTRLVTKKQVTVQIVYVVDDNSSNHHPNFFDFKPASNPSIQYSPLNSKASAFKSATPVFTQPTHQPVAASPRVTSVDPSYFRAMFYQDQFAQANRVLSQARSLAEEWSSSFKAHLRFGCLAAELKKAVEAEAAAALLLGCNSINHPLVQQLGDDFPCPVLGIPSVLNLQEDFNQDQ
ncbi:universal stress protein [Trichocoleus sp. FACHB-90]|uniref:universal stress protein n=1 Tax=Cyanophyceae TaxID=3028117 RepID=UPI001682F040|nr:universal stress protein [Trichocoleus sp. FACHB-90]MBD1928468.1 universal stress protein [Trichocoleus sp. FACHB-90]